MTYPYGISMVCGACCGLSNYALGSTSLLLTTLLAAACLVATCIVLLFKLVVGFRQVATTALRGRSAVVVSSFYFRFLLAAFSLLVAEAFVLFLPLNLSWGLYLNSTFFALRHALISAPVWYSLGTAHVKTRLVIGVGGSLGFWLLVLFLMPIQHRLGVVGSCELCQHFLPLSPAVLYGIIGFTALHVLLFFLAGKDLFSWCPRGSIRAYLAFLVADGVMCITGLSFALFSSEPSLGDLGICFATFDVVIFCVCFALACYYSFSSDSKLLWAMQKSSEHASLLAQYWRTEDLIGISQNETIHIIEEHELTLVRQIGRGAYGMVSLYEWLGQEVAVKTLHEGDPSPDAVRVLAHEIETIGMLRHPNVVALLGVCPSRSETELGVSLMMVFEYASGGSLFERLHHRLESSLQLHVIAPETIRRWVREICSGMAYMHARGVMHRDLKSPNILLSGADTAMICDFGVARAFSVASSTGAMIQTMVGTPAWTAPEVIRGEMSCLSADVYSFGVILWEMLTRQVPLDGMTPIQVLGKVMQAEDEFCFLPVPALQVEDGTEVLSALMLLIFVEPQKRPSFQQLLLLLHGNVHNWAVDVALKSQEMKNLSL